jgi:hypothetical protein
MAKTPTTEMIAAELTVPERVLLFCLASGTNWVKAGDMPVRNLVERDHAAADFVRNKNGTSQRETVPWPSPSYPA